MAIGTIADNEAGSSVRAKLNQALAAIDDLTGMIVMWSGTIATIPSGWALCDGTNGTPDLRDRFIVGAKQDDSGQAKTNITGALTQSGGAASHKHNLSSFISELDTTVTDATDERQNADTDPQPVLGPAGMSNMVANAAYIDTNTTTALPPYYALAFIMKL